MKKELSLEDVKKAIRDVPDFPKKGIIFRDLTTAIKQPEILKYIVDTIYDYYKDKGITKVLGIESRGFILGSVLAYRLHAGLVLVRKPGKLPAEKFSKSYALEYGEDTVEIHKDAIKENDVVLIHDDLLATGGTSYATAQLLDYFNVKQKYLNFLVELDFLNGRKKIEQFGDIFTLIHY